MPAAFGRLCVETLLVNRLNLRVCFQPPSGGCVLKLKRMLENNQTNHPAAFGRLCVETAIAYPFIFRGFPAAFGRLCVETKVPDFVAELETHPAAFGRLCVETELLNT